MKIILDKEKYNAIWEKIYKEFQFNPSTSKSKHYKCLKLPFKYKQYKIKNVWNENEEKRIGVTECYLILDQIQYIYGVMN